MRDKSQHRHECTAGQHPRRDQHHFRRGHHDDFDGPARFGRHAGPFGRFGRGPGRFFESGDLRFVILHLIHETPRHGYEIIKSIQDKLGGAYAPSPGIIYPMLIMLEEMGHATVTTEGTRKLYAITPEGEAYLAENRAIIDAIFQRMQAAGAQQSSERPPQMMRAIENFKLAVRMKTATALTTDQLNAIVDIIDNAAKQIERS